MVPFRTKYKPPPQAVVIDYAKNIIQWFADNYSADFGFYSAEILSRRDSRLFQTVSPSSDSHCERQAIQDCLYR